jgi:TolB protein
VVIHYVNLTTASSGPPCRCDYTPFLGLSDPAFSPDGRILAYTMEGRTGRYGAPPICGSTPADVAHELAAGYRAASWSPDGKYVAATRVSGDTLNVVVLDARTGKQVDQVTSDGASWAPVWSPDGDKLVYMHLSGPNVNLNMVYISGTGRTSRTRSSPT